MKKLKCSPLARFLDKGVSLYAYGSALFLVIFMLFSFFIGIFNFISKFRKITSLEGAERHALDINILSFIAFTIVMIKAYRILISYAKTQHVNIKYFTEIAIIAPAIEILFNSHVYKLETLILFGVFSLANLVIYVWKYDKFKEIGHDENEEPL